MRQRERRHTVLRVTEVEDEYSSATREAAPEDEQDAFDRLGGLFKPMTSGKPATNYNADCPSNPVPRLLRRPTHKPHQVSHAAIHGISGALDHLHSLRMLIQQASSLHTYAPFTLCRAAIEGGAIAAGYCRLRAATSESGDGSSSHVSTHATPMQH